MRTLPRVLLAAAVASTLAACGMGVESSSQTGGDQPASAPADDTTDDDTTDDDMTDDTSMPADEDAEPSGEVTEAEAEAVANAYLGLTEEEAQAQAEVDGRPFRVGARDGEQLMLTEDYVLGRVTASINDGVITAVTVESTDGPVTVESTES